MLEFINTKLFVSGKPITSTVALMDGEFKLAGEVIAMSILQEGPAPCFFAEEVVKYLTKTACFIRKEWCCI